MFWNATQWSESGDDRCLKPEFASTKHFVKDGSDYKAILITAPDFGCVSHCAIATITNQPGELTK